MIRPGSGVLSRSETGNAFASTPFQHLRLRASNARHALAPSYPMTDAASTAAEAAAGMQQGSGCHSNMTTVRAAIEEALGELSKERRLRRSAEDALESVRVREEKLRTVSAAHNPRQQSATDAPCTLLPHFPHPTPYISGHAAAPRLWW